MQLEDFDEALVEEVTKLRLLLGGDPEDTILFYNEDEQGAAFEFDGTMDELRQFAFKNKCPIVCITHPEILAADDTPATWLVGGIAITKSIVNIYFTDMVSEGNRYFSFDVGCTNVVLLFAVQISPDIDYVLELKKEADDSLGFCIYPQTEEPAFNLN